MPIHGCSDSKEPPYDVLTEIVQESRPSGSTSTPRDPPIFGCGEIVAERFEICRFLGQGGMGQVFEATDLELDGRLALKVIRPRIARRRQAIERFKREVQLARKVTHPNVCRIFDLYSHRARAPVTWGESNGTLLFLTMELLRGETLSVHLARHGPFAPDEALRLITQMAAALDAAHSVGVAHLDFKTSNVMLVSDADGPRAVVTDFGLSQASPGGDEEPRATGGERGRAGDGRCTLEGTPAYLAPELAEGREPTPAADVYAFGLVVSEMLTGRLPSETRAAEKEGARSRLENGHIALVHDRSDLPSPWGAVVARCLEHRPERRFQHAGEAAAALSGTAPRRPPPTIGRSDRSILVTASLFLLCLLAMAGWKLIPKSEAPPAPVVPQTLSAASITARPTLAVFGFRDLSQGAGAGWISVALAEMLSAEIAASERLRIVSGGSLSRMRRALELPEKSHTRTHAMARISEYLGSDFVVMGTYTWESDHIHLDLSLLRTPDVEMARWQDSISAPSLAAESTRLARRIERALGVETLGLRKEKRIQLGLPTRLEAARWYAEGLSALRRFDFDTAREHLERAARLEPEASAIYAALTEALDGQGFERKALDAARRAFELRTHLPRERRLFLEGRFHEAGRRWSLARKSYTDLRSLFGDHLEAGLRLVAVETITDPEKSIATIALLKDRHLRAVNGGSDPKTEMALHIYLAEAQAARARGIHRLSLQAAKRTIEISEALDTKLITAQARLLEAEALSILGQPDPAEASLAAAVETFIAHGDVRSLARATLHMPDLFLAVAGPEKGMTLERAVEVFREIGDRGGEALALARLGRHQMDRMPEVAQENLERSLALAREIDDPRATCEALKNLAILEFVYEREREAYLLTEEALEAARRSGNLSLWAGTLQNQAALAMRLEDPQRAHQLFEEAVEIARSIEDQRILTLALTNFPHLRSEPLDKRLEQCEEAWSRSHEIHHPIMKARSLECLGRIALDQHRPAEARRAYAAAVRIWKETGDTLSADYRQIDICQTWLEEKRLPTAADCTRSILDQRPLQGGEHISIRAQILLARIALESQEFVQAHRLSQEALPLLSLKDDPRLRRDGLTIAARAEKAAGRDGDSVGVLRELLARAAAVGDRRRECELRLDLARFLKASGARKAARSEFEEVRRQAAANSFGWISDDAARELGPGR